MSRKTEIRDAEKKKDSIKDKIDVLEKDKDNLKHRTGNKPIGFVNFCGLRMHVPSFSECVLR